MARPKKDITRDQWLPKVRATQAELAAVEARCAASGLPMSEFVRAQMLNGAVIQRQPLADKALVRSLAAIGNNLNQIARKANTTGEILPDTQQHIRDVLSRLEDAIDGLIGEC